MAEGYSFTLQYNGKQYSTWECCKRRSWGCKAIVKAYPKSNHVELRRTHNHNPVGPEHRYDRGSPNAADVDGGAMTATFTDDMDEDDPDTRVENTHNVPIITERHGEVSIGGSPTTPTTASEQQQDEPFPMNLLRPVKFTGTNF